MGSRCCFRMLALLLLLLALTATSTHAAPSSTHPDALEGIDEFLAAFSGLALEGDPLAEKPEGGEEEEGHVGENGGGDVSLFRDLGPVTEEPAVTEVAPCLGCVINITTDSSALRNMTSRAATLLEDVLQTNSSLVATQVYSLIRETTVNGEAYSMALEVAESNCSRLLEPVINSTCAPLEDAERELFILDLLQEREHGNLVLIASTPIEEIDAPGLFADPEVPVDIFPDTLAEAMSESGADAESTADPSAREESPELLEIEEGIFSEVFVSDPPSSC